MTMPDLICFTHLRWNWVLQRPQHLLSRAAQDRRVFIFEEPLKGDGPPRLEITMPQPNVWVMVPHVPPELDDAGLTLAQKDLLDLFIRQEGIAEYVLWYYTPMALSFTRHLEPLSIIYDCMDELAAFAGAPPELKALEKEMMMRCHVVFTGGYSLYEAKRTQHSNDIRFPAALMWSTSRSLAPGKVTLQTRLKFRHHGSAITA